MKLLRNSTSMTRPGFGPGKILLYVLPAVLLVGLASLLAADFWVNKTYYEWSDKECATMLTKSPWSWPLELVKQGGLGSSDAAEGQQKFQYSIRFLSALPIRQAMVRQAQIAQKYDGLTNDQKQAFDKSTEGFLNADYGDKVVISITYSTNIRREDQNLIRFWQSQTMELMKNSVYLYAGKGPKARLLDFKVAQGAQQEFQFIFPRQVDGKPIATEQDKNLTLEFTYPVLAGIGDGRGYAEFKVKNMILNGMLMY